MSKTMMTAAFAALLAASPMALAQTTAMTPNNAVTTNRIEPGQIRGTDMKGSSVYDAQNNKVGSISDMILDRGGQVAAVVLDVDGKTVAVGMHDLKFAMNDDNKLKTITIDKSRSDLN
ncbi:MAG: PRC-barrel domain-containing protein, partial [Bradyrhizobium sp.]